MARYQNIVFVTLLCVYDLFIVESKIFSKSVGDISIFQQPEVNTYTREQNLRTRRSAESENANYTLSGNSIHSQNLTLNTTTFSLHGVNDNEVFVHWSGENNDVSHFVYDNVNNRILVSVIKLSRCILMFAICTLNREFSVAYL